MKFELEIFNRNIPDKELIEDLRRVSKIIKKKTITIEEYQSYGNYSWNIFRRRYGSWHNALKEAGYNAGKAKNHVTEAELFDNLRLMWEQLGRQPRAKEVKKPFSKFACNTYLRRFGSWQNALKSFIEYIVSDSDVPQSGQEIRTGSFLVPKTEMPVRRTSRDISERLRFRILLRDGFACTSCGSSPLKSRNVDLHVDHILPWSKGGETEPNNLTTKCSRCNLGKGDLLEK